VKDIFKARDLLKVGKKQYIIYRLDVLEKTGLTEIKRLPFSIRIMLEAALRQCNDREITQDDVKNIAAWTPSPNGAGRGGSSRYSLSACARDHAGFHRSSRTG
jgi:aconitase A